MSTGTPNPQHPAAALHFRRSSQRLTDGQADLLRSAFADAQAVGDDRGYEYFAGIHGLPLPISCDNAHGTPYFLPWHRAYLYFFELALRRLHPDATLTWWDWRTPAGTAGRIPALFADEQAAGGENPLYSAAVDPVALEQGRRQGMDMAARTIRQPGQPGAGTLPSADEVQAVLEVTDFGTFTSRVEQLHNRVHVWVGGAHGHMGQIPFAAFDPIFWAHHAMIDRLWRLWQVRHAPGPGGVPAAILHEALPPFRMTVAQTIDVAALGYDYAGATASQAL